MSTAPSACKILHRMEILRAVVGDPSSVSLSIDSYPRRFNIAWRIIPMRENGGVRHLWGGMHTLSVRGNVESHYSRSITMDMHGFRPPGLKP
jgi:hypothetical protein